MTSKRRPEKWREFVELLGSFLQCDGNTEVDTTKRLVAARKRWYKINRQLPRLGLEPRDKWRVVEATVEATLLYASQTRPMASKEMAMYQSLMNRVLWGVTLSEKYRIRDMKGKETMADLRAKVGAVTVETAVGKRKLGYLGHLATTDWKSAWLLENCAWMAPWTRPSAATICRGADSATSS